MKKRSSIPDDNRMFWTPYIEEIGFWYGGGRGRWPTGREVALVFGKVLRYWGLQRTSCRVAVRRLAGELAMSDKTARRCLLVLQDDGLIIDQTPDRRNRPHEYTVTSTAPMMIRAVRAMHKEAGKRFIGDRSSGTVGPTEWDSVTNQEPFQWDSVTKPLGLCDQ